MVHHGAGRKRSGQGSGQGRTGKIEEVDLFEINEAFAVVAMTPIKELGIDACQGQRQRRAPVRWGIRSAPAAPGLW